MKRTIVIAIMAGSLLMLTFNVQAKSDNAGPADKITGGLEIKTSIPTITATMEFTAHAAKGKRPCKGTIRWCRPDQPRTIVWEVTYVKVQGNSGVFIGRKIQDTNPGPAAKDWVVIKVVDGGSPGQGNDTIGIANVADEAAAQACADAPGGVADRPIVAGNLVVHSK